jgi:hypothetical protein
VPEALLELLARAISPDVPNRPATGEWQLALRRALADGELRRRHPGPQPRQLREPTRQRPEPAVKRVAPPPLGRMPLATRAPAAYRAPAKREATLHGPHGFMGFTVAWLVAGVLLLFLFARLLQSAGVSSPALGFGGERPPGYPTGALPLQRGQRAYESPGGSSVQEEGGTFEPGTPRR